MMHSVKGKTYGYWVRNVNSVHVVKPQLEQSQLNHIGTVKLWIFKIQRSLNWKSQPQWVKSVYIPRFKAFWGQKYDFFFPFSSW